MVRMIPKFENSGPMDDDSDRSLIDTFNSSSNRYFIFRHGESYANQEHVIVSAINGSHLKYGLTPQGRREVAENITKCFSEGEFQGEIQIISSPFLRALESAEIAAQILNAPVSVDDRLRERDFGGWENTSDSNYELVWAKDRKDPSQKDKGVESVQEVYSRAIAVISDIENSIQNKNIILCTHGDVASALITGFHYGDLNHHRENGSLKTAEIKELIFDK